MTNNVNKLETIQAKQALAPVSFVADRLGRHDNRIPAAPLG